ncbi:MAG: sulfite exporter TauE/SafE family protein [Phycisphaerales bacterium]
MIAAFASSVAAGFLGALLGLGGGIIVVPVLTLLLGLDIRYAIGASIVSVIATSSAAGAAYVRDHLANVRVAMFLEVATTIGALGGAMLAGVLDPRWLYIVFGLVLGAVSLAMLRHSEEAHGAPSRRDPLSDRLKLGGRIHDPRTASMREYAVVRPRLGFGVSVVAGGLSGLLGVGGGVMKVPMMTLGMGMPMKAATATSNLMIGVTAAASAGVYFSRGDIEPFVAGPVAVGILVGALTGARTLGRIQSRALRIAFTIVMLVVAVQMLHKGLA